MPATKITLEKAKQDKLFYVVGNVVIYRESDQRCLILKRDDREIAHPGKYAVPGGKLEWKDLDLTKPTKMNGDIFDFDTAMEDLLKREAKEEAGIEIEGPLHYVNNGVFVRPDGIPVLLVKFAAKYKSGEVVLERGAFTSHAWVNAEEVKSYPSILGIPEEIAQTIQIYQKKESSLNDIQHEIKKFDDSRGWGTISQMKDLLLNMGEEIGEMWSIIKWVDVQTQERLIRENKPEVENFIGDMLFLLLKVAYLSGIDSEKSIKDVLAEYETRFPIDKARGNHGNVRAGGIDFKHNTQ